MDKRKIILSALGLLLIVGAVFGAKYIIDSNVKEKPPVTKTVKSVFIDTVKNRVVPIVVPANGNITALHKLELFSEVQGIFRYSSKDFRPGQPYNKGQVLLSIDAEEYRAGVQSAKSELYNNITSIMPDLRLDYPKVFQKWEAYLNSFDMSKPVPSLPELETEKERYFITGRGIVSSYYTVKNLEERLAKYTIVAPYNGILTEALVNRGTLIRPGQKLGEFIDPNVYELEVSIAKKFSDILEIGKKVELSNLEGNKTFEGTVSRINAKVNQETQSIRVYITVRNPELSEGMYLEAKLDAKDEPDAIEIPRELLVERSKVFVVQDSTLNLVNVNPVYFTNNTVVIKGLENGTRILSANVPGAYSGMLVKVEGQRDLLKKEQS
ncbi:HlyD family efflux transporter periplasmic adaptor subunit [Gramella sp. GC03-9]|uniref:HlyD family efflux transporter periplasmic adaptor subunit n=2 Tax=Christiangramia oceanisediminis TaxID=2920386 RepID=A0A9X2KXF5_9FLAO|nr:HlyD family efflux transporter periplasmic adaptor subunit [Gramella oceanisediminis]MCP9199606.1 HlyD family efflux transporter periplasmic adaptor subunit [Gramella oceanisediminis]